MRPCLIFAFLLLGCAPRAGGGGDDDDVANDDDDTACTPTSPAEAAACVDEAAYAADIELLAVARPPGTDGWQAAQDHCREVLTALGFEVEDHVYATGTNIVGIKAGAGPSRRQVLVSAHYDSVGGCEGADDNASGVSGALGVARAVAAGSWDQDLVIACWDEEERGLIGSRAYAQRAMSDGDDIEVAISLEMIAFTDDAAGSQQLPAGFEVVFPEAVAAVEARDRRGDFIAFVGDEAADPMVDALVEQAPDSLPTLRIDVPDSLLGSPAIGDLTRSDHAAFWDVGVPAIMVTDTANFRYAGYQCGDGSDSVSRLDLAFAVDVTRATAAAAAARLGASSN